jgi:hypothetical protein
MKRIILAASLAFCVTTPFAQIPEIPKHNCTPKPEYPGRLAMQSDSRAKVFERDIKAYQACMNKYLDERKAMMKANEENANAAIAEYNEVMKSLNAATAKANE